MVIFRLALPLICLSVAVLLLCYNFSIGGNKTQQERVLRRFDPKTVEKKTENCCLDTGKRCIWERLPPYTIPECEKQNLLHLLSWVKNVFDEYNTNNPNSAKIEWMITAGTLLGSVRGKGHIPHETDIDIQVDANQSSLVFQLIQSKLNDTQSHIQFTKEHRLNEPSRLFFSKTNQIHVDLWAYQKKQDDGGKKQIQEVAAIEGRGHVFVVVDYNIIFPLSQCEYEDGNMYPCPHRSEQYVQLKYGKDWNIPKPKYSPKSTYKDGDDSALELVHRMN